jgi:spermidine/putrescine-binding protein
MADGHGDYDVILLDPRRNQRMAKKKLFEEMLLKEIPG